MNATRTLDTVRRSGRRAGPRIVALVLACAATVGCEGLLDVDLPTRVPSTTLDDPALAEVVVLGAVGDFECAFTNYVAATGLLTDEMISSATWAAVIQWDQRRVFSSTGSLTSGCTALGYGVFTPLQTARFQAEHALELLEGFSDADVPNRQSLIATAAAYAGYSLTLLGEGFCEMTVDEGPLMTPDETLSLAEDRFTRAITEASEAGEDDIRQMALVGRARVRLNLGRLDEAAADAREVSAGYVRHATRSGASERRWNRLYMDQYQNFFLSVHPKFRDVEWLGVPDPRLEVTFSGRKGMDQTTDVWLQHKYESQSDPLPIASWEEAQLIIAEAEGGQTAVGIINALHAEAGLPDFDGGDASEIMDHVIQERSHVLYLEGHRLNDMLRFDLPFDSGVDHTGVPYGETTCLPLPQSELDNNPEL